MTLNLPQPATLLAAAAHGLLLAWLLAAPARPVQPPRILQVSLIAPASESRPVVQRRETPAPPKTQRPVPPRQTPRPAETAQPQPPAPPAPAAPTEAAVVPARFDADYLKNPPPPYPALAKRMGEEGTVRLRVRVSPDGLAESVEIKASSGSARLDQAALDTVRRWRFVPARQGSQAVAAWVVVPITFHLNQES